jgi:hypothetical protein
MSVYHLMSRNPLRTEIQEHWHQEAHHTLADSSALFSGIWDIQIFVMDSAYQTLGIPDQKAQKSCSDKVFGTIKTPRKVA